MTDNNTPPMPPPSTTIRPRTPPPLTLVQLLKAPLAPHPAKAGSDDDEPEPVPHTSSKNNLKYDPVDPGCLLMLTDTKVERFCDYITALSGFVTFPDNMKQPFSASTISNEGDVTAYLESQVVIPAWEAVTRMFPPAQRDYDILNRRQFCIEDGRPDIVFGSKVLGEGGRHVFTPRAVLEFKRPGIVEGLLPVFVKKLYRTSRARSEPPRGWITVMQQLRKYVIQTGCTHILVMDERVGIYLDFDDPMADHEDVHFLLSVPPDLITDENRLIAPHGLTLRELLVFMCYRAFGKVYDLRRIPVPDPTTIDPVDCTGYSSALPPDVSSQARKHSLHDTSERRQQPKRTVTTRVQPVFSAWIPGTTITLRLLSEDTAPASPLSSRTRAVSNADSGFHESDPPRDPDTRPFNPPTPTSGRPTTFTVSTVFARAAALLTSPSGTQYIGKLFSPLHTRTAHELLANEVTAYAAALPLQGRHIPHFYGTWSVVGAGTAHLAVVITEFVAPGRTVAQLPVEEVRALWESASTALTALHECGVRHGDLEARNLIVAEGGGVVMVDFDVAQVRAVGGRWRWVDWAVLRDVFGVLREEGEEQEGDGEVVCL